MNHTLVKCIADATLYEGYILYPYRPSAKNCQRWTIGGLYPEAYCRMQAGSDASGNQTVVLVRGGPATAVDALVRFLQLTERSVGELLEPGADPLGSAEPPFRPVQVLRVGNDVYHRWQEAEEREVSTGPIPLADLLARPHRRHFTFPGGRRTELIRGPGGSATGALIRVQQPVEGLVEVSAHHLATGLCRVMLRIMNLASPEDVPELQRDAVLLRTLVAAHTVLGVRDGAFVSLLDPPDQFREAAAACRNVGTWPVLVGAEGDADAMLSSPIILYDYPQVAPESPVDFFDGTEIDEMLVLRIMTLTDEEKRAMAAIDRRAADLLVRAEALARERLCGLHGAVRGLRPLPGGGAE
jgi:hydrogenase maturation protease